MQPLPYGLADFETLRREGYLYLDRTAHIRTLESLGRSLLFIRPRRFGKSLWLRTLAAYYDLLTADAHDELFGDLAMGAEPTPSAHQYFVMVWNFSEVETLGGDSLGARLNAYLLNELTLFLRRYREQLPEIPLPNNATDALRRVLAAIRETPWKLYLLIDEYDNFANETMVADEDAYHALVRAEGPLKNLMKSVKSATEGQGLDRLFITGVSPVVMSDLTSGMNMLEDVYLEPELADLCGFREAEIERILETLHAERASDDDGASPAWTPAEALRILRTWYNGYRFSPDTEEKVYNPTLSLYFLKALERGGAYPRQMLDANLATDEDKLRYLSRRIAGRQAMVDVVQNDAPLEIPRLEPRFRLRDLLGDDPQSETFLASFLYFFGMLTLDGTTPRRTLRLTPPNLVVRKLFVDAVRRLLLPSAERAGAVVCRGIAGAVRGGDVEGVRGGRVGA